MRGQHFENHASLALYREGLILLMPPNDLGRITSAQHLFERIIDIDPGFGGGYAGKGFTHSVTALFFKTPNPTAELQQGIELSIKAIEIDPEFSMGYVTLAFAYALSGRHKEALFNARQAIAVQPGDAFTQFVNGLCLMLAGQPQEALAHFQEARRLDPAEPRTPYRNNIGIAYLSLGNYTAASETFEENLRIGGPTGPHMDMFRAIAFAELGEVDRARSLLHDMKKRSPDFPVERWLAHWVKNEDLYANAMAVLDRHGTR